MAQQHFNPWLEIFVQPKKTIAQLLAGKYPAWWVNCLLIVSTALWVMGMLYRANVLSGNDQIFYLPLALMCGVLDALIFTPLFARVMIWCGRSHDSVRNAKLALAWGRIPILAAQLCLWLLPNEMPIFLASLGMEKMPAYWFLWHANVQILINIWLMVIFTQCLGPAQRVSAWQALGNYLYGLLVVAAPFMFVMSIKMIFFGHTAWSNEYIVLAFFIAGALIFSVGLGNDTFRVRHVPGRHAGV